MFTYLNFMFGHDLVCRPPGLDTHATDETEQYPNALAISSVER